MKEVKELKKVIDNGLCNRCGSCVGLSGGKIRFTQKEGRYLPVILEEPDEETMQTILHACSGRSFDFPSYTKEIYGKDTPFHQYVGAYQKIRIGFSTDNEVRLNSGSGGIISSLLIYLLEKEEIDGAVVLGMDEKKPWLTKPFIARTRKEIMEAAQSKYIISSNNEILPEIADFKGNLAYVGLPGQVQSIRSLQKIDHPSVKNIKYIFGPFYGNTLHFSSIKGFLRSYGEKDYTQIQKLYFRHGEWPGNMRVELKSGKVYQLKKFHANYLIPFHIVKNGLICTDLTNEFTDISGGDAWAPVYEERGKGFSMIISRSEKGEELINRMIRDGFMEAGEITEDESITMHSHGYDLKKRGSFIRIKFMKLLGRPVPDYGYSIAGFGFGRYLMEIMLDTLFVLFSTRLFRWFSTVIPPAVIGGVFEKTRTFWKKITYGIKRRDL